MSFSFDELITQIKIIKSLALASFSFEIHYRLSRVLTRMKKAQARCFEAQKTMLQKKRDAYLAEALNLSSEVEAGALLEKRNEEANDEVAIFTSKPMFHSHEFTLEDQKIKISELANSQWDSTSRFAVYLSELSWLFEDDMTEKWRRSD